MRNRVTVARARAGRRSAVSIAALAVLIGGAQAQTRATLPAVTVQSAPEEGYTARESSPGILGDIKLVDTPFSVNVINRKIIEDQQAQHYGDYFKNDPSVGIGNVPVGFITLRGYQASLDSYLYDGIPGTVLSDGRYQLVGFERIEVLKGASAFLYGVTPSSGVGGVVNYIPKRPLDSPVRSAKIGFVSRSLFTAEADLGDRFGPGGQFGYRLNMAFKDGDQAVKNAEWNHKAATLALDWRLSRDFVLSGNLEYAHQHFPRLQPFFLLTPGVELPKAPNTRRNIAQPFDDFKVIQGIANVRADWQISQNWSATAQFLRARNDRPRVLEARFGSITSNAGAATLFVSEDENKTDTRSAQLTIRGKFDTGPVNHQVAFAVADSRVKNEGAYTLLAFYPTNIYDPMDGATPAAPNTPLAKNPGSKSRSYAISDTIKFNDWFSTLVGVRHVRIEAEPNDAQTKNTPVVALILKPSSNMSVYANYAQGLELGTTAAAPATNAGTQLPARPTRQIELGVKAEVGKMLLTAAVFDMRRPLEFLVPGGPLVQQGTQRHRGVELVANGAVTPDLAVVAGLTYLRPTQLNTGDPTAEGKDPGGVPRWVGNVFADYRLGFVPGLFVNGGVYAVGKQYYDNQNTQRVPGFVRFDAGARYETTMFAKPTVLRFNVENVMGKDYWASALGSVLTLAEPRTYKLSAQMGF